MSISDIVSWYPLILLGVQSKPDNFLCWHSIYFMFRMLLAVRFGAGFLCHSVKILVKTMYVWGTVLNVSIFQVSTVGVKRK